jgi:hypothetical protein
MTSKRAKPRFTGPGLTEPPFNQPRRSGVSR